MKFSIPQKALLTFAITMFCSLAGAYQWHIETCWSLVVSDDVMAITNGVTADDTLPSGVYYVYVMRNGVHDDTFSFRVNDDRSVSGGYGTTALRFSDGTTTIETDGNLYSAPSGGNIVGSISSGSVSGTWTRGPDTCHGSTSGTYHSFNGILKASGRKCKDQSSSPGAPGGGLGSLHMTFGLGAGTNIQTQSQLSIDTEMPIAAAATPAGLLVRGVPVWQSVSGGVLRQIMSVDVLADIVTNNAFRYTVNFYRAVDAGTLGTNGLYQPMGSPFKYAIIENPDASTTVLNRLWATVIEGNATNLWQFTASTNSTQLTNTWQLVYPGNLKKEVLSTTIAPNWSQKTTVRSVFTPGTPDILVYQEKNIYQDFGAGPMQVLQIIGTNGVALTNTWAYYTNSAQEGSYGRLQQMTRWDGYWEQYQYDSAGRETNRLSPFLNSALGSAASSCRAVSTSYSSNAPNITAVETVLGQEVSRTYTGYYSASNAVKTVRCQTLGGSFTDAANLVTTVNADTFNRPTTVWNQDGTMAFYTYVTNIDNSVTTTMTSGQANGAGTAIAEGTKTVTVVGASGQTISNIVINVTTGACDGIVLSKDSYSYASDDYAFRSPTILHLDGTITSGSIGCCGAPNYGNTVDRDGTTNYLTYDALQRTIASKINGVTTTNVLDANGNTMATIRIGTDDSVITNRVAAYDFAGQLILETDGLSRTTAYTNYFDGLGQLVKKTIFPDAGTRLETYFLDGQLQSITGSAVPSPMRYDCGVEQDGGVYRLYTKEIKLNSDGSDTSEWTKTYKDMLGRDYKTVYASATGTPYSISYFNNKGQLTNQTDPDGAIVLYQYNGKGEQEYEVLDINRNGAIDFAGTDRITRSVRDVSTDNNVNVYRSRTFVWTTNGSAESNLISTVEWSVEGLRSFNIKWNNGVGITNSTQNFYDAVNGCRIVTTTAPDGSYTVVTNLYGRQLSITRYDSTGTQVGQNFYGYDAHGRQNAVTDARVGVSTVYFDNADNVTNTVAPAPASGQNAPSTSYFFDGRNRVWKTTLPDGTSVTNEFEADGLTGRNYGSRVYPAGYGFDYAGRTSTMTNWSGFANGVGSRMTTWNYDPYRGWLANEVYDGNIAGPSYTYTRGGRLQARTWSRGVTTTYGYTGAGDLSSVNYSDSTPAVLTDYDRRGRKTAVTNGVAVTQFVLNDANHVLLETNRSGILAGLKVASAYDQYLRRTNLAFSGQPVGTRYSYDAASRLQSVGDGTNLAAYSYLPNSTLVDNIAYTQNGTLRLVRSNQFDNLNRLTNLVWKAGGVTVASFAYQYNAANQRTHVTLADGSYWLYQYDALGQVTSGNKYWADGTPVAGQQFGYGFDDIGNRTNSVVGGDATGTNLRYANYTNNSLNQLTSRDVPGYINVIGAATNTAAVTVNGQVVYRRNNYFWAELATNNAANPVYMGITNVAFLVGTTNPNYVATNIGYALLPQTPEHFEYDADGNMTNSGWWNIAWDGENRALSFTTLDNLPSAAKTRIECTYDWQGRRTQKIISAWNGSSYVPQTTNKFVYDDWNLVAILDQSNNLLESFTWGTDLSGSMQGAGGVGGLISMTVYSGTNAGVYFYCFDGNGNVVALVNAANGTVAAQYEYGAFGEIIHATGSMAKTNPLLFATKFDDWESGLSYYGYRYYDAILGRWLSRDPIAEAGGVNLYILVQNSPVQNTDFLGLSDYNMPPISVVGPHVSYNWGSVGPFSSTTDNYSGSPYTSYEISGDWFRHRPGEGEPCCEKPAQIVLFKRNDSISPFTGTITMSAELIISGSYRNLVLLWHTCYRPDGTVDFIPKYSNSFTCPVPGWNPFRQFLSEYQTDARISFLSCEGNKWKTVQLSAMRIYKGGKHGWTWSP